MNEAHLLHKIPDYVLELLPASERVSLERHAAHCELCQSALQSERRLHRLVSHTIAAPSTPFSLPKWHPPVASRMKAVLKLRPWQAAQPAWALICLTVFLVAGLFAVQPSRNNPAIIPVPSPTAIVATATQGPTHTATHSIAFDIPLAKTPDVGATPIAGLLPLAGN